MCCYVWNSGQGHRQQENGHNRCGHRCIPCVVVVYPLFDCNPEVVKKDQSPPRSSESQTRCVPSSFNLSSFWILQFHLSSYILLMKRQYVHASSSFLLQCSVCHLLKSSRQMLHININHPQSWWSSHICILLSWLYAIFKYSTTYNKRGHDIILVFLVSEFARNEVQPNLYSYTELKVATEDFSPDMRLGQGGFGVVYKVKLPSRPVIVIDNILIDIGTSEVNGVICNIGSLF